MNYGAVQVLRLALMAFMVLDLALFVSVLFLQTQVFAGLWFLPSGGVFGSTLRSLLTRSGLTKFAALSTRMDMALMRPKWARSSRAPHASHVSQATQRMAFYAAELLLPLVGVSAPSLSTPSPHVSSRLTLSSCVRPCARRRGTR